MTKITDEVRPLCNCGHYHISSSSFDTGWVNYCQVCQSYHDWAPANDETSRKYLKDKVKRLRLEVSHIQKILAS